MKKKEEIEEVSTEDKKTAIKALIKTLNPKGAKAIGSHTELLIGVQGRISTGSIGLDYITGGGYPKGRLVEIFGAESCGKTTLALEACKAVQVEGGVAAYYDAEQALDIEYAKRLGVNVDDLIFISGSNAEEDLNIIEQLIKSSMISLIVIDSIAALASKKELIKNIGEDTVGVQARLMSSVLRRWATLVKKSQTTILFTNQTRSKINTMSGIQGKTTSGGNAMPFYASFRLDLRPIKSVKKGDIKVGQIIQAEAVKNKVFPAYKKARFQISAGYGIEKEKEVLALATSLGLVSKAGKWYYIGDRSFDGIDGIVRMFSEEPEEYTRIRQIVIDKVNERMEKIRQSAATTGIEEDDAEGTGETGGDNQED